MVEVPVFFCGRHIEPYLPELHSQHAACADLRADIPECLTLLPGAFALISTGLAFAIPIGFEGQVRSRSGLAARCGVFVLNAPGIIDSDYRGDVGVVLANFGQAEFEVRPGDRVAQFGVFCTEPTRYMAVASLDETARGAGGFGSTGRG